MNTNPMQGGIAADLAAENYRLMQSEKKALARIERLEGALGALLDRLDAIHVDPTYMAVWTLHQMHCGPYRGPQYDGELEEARAALNEEA